MNGSKPKLPAYFHFSVIKLKVFALGNSTPVPIEPDKMRRI